MSEKGFRRGGGQRGETCAPQADKGVFGRCWPGRAGCRQGRGVRVEALCSLRAGGLQEKPAPGQSSRAWPRCWESALGTRDLGEQEWAGWGPDAAQRSPAQASSPASPNWLGEGESPSLRGNHCTAPGCFRCASSGVSSRPFPGGARPRARRKKRRTGADPASEAETLQQPLHAEPAAGSPQFVFEGVGRLCELTKQEGGARAASPLLPDG